MDASLLIPCSHCGAMNRVPSSRLAEAPVCGLCHEPVFAGKPIALTAADFDRHATRSELPLLVTGTFGKGRTVAWTSDVGPHWLPPGFIAWSGYKALFEQMIGWAAGE